MSQVFALKVTDSDTGEKNITVFVVGNPDSPQSAHESHPSYDAIVEAADNGDENVLDLFDVSTTAERNFSAITDRISVANGRVYLDGDEVDTVLTKQIVRFLNEGVNDWIPLVNFYEKVLSNPNEHSREQLFAWLDGRDFTITNEGDFIAYKGVQARDGGYVSVNSGHGIVDGQEQNGHLPNNIGSTVEIPRSEVAHDPSVPCASGLHVGDYSYAKSWARGGLLTVVVNPRDVVSVPTDCSAAKVRVCRYLVQDVAPQAQIASPLYDTSVDYDDDEWGDNEYDDNPDW